MTGLSSLDRDGIGGAGMVVDGLPATALGELERGGESSFRGQETIRLRRGGLLVVGDVVGEARRRLLRRAGRGAALFALSATVMSLVALGVIF